MPDQKIFINPFVQGLNTETSDLNDQGAFTSDELNCTIYSENIRGRRFGFDIERDGQYKASGKTGRSFRGFFWKNVGRTPTDFIVYQVDDKLFFYRATSKPFSESPISSSVDLTKYITDVDQFYANPVNFSTSGLGKLMVVSKYMNPIMVSYDFGTNTLSVEELRLKIRDIEGVQDGLAVDEQYSTSLTENKYHTYNLYNQGWTSQNIDAFKTATSRWPSNNLQHFVGKDNSGSYNTEQLLKVYFGNTPAPKGHFILDYFEKDRGAKSGITINPGRTAAYAVASGWVKNRSLGYNPIYSATLTFPSSEGTAIRVYTSITNIEHKVAKKAWGTYRDNITITVYGLSAGVWTVVASDVHFFDGASSYSFSFPNETSYESYKVEYIPHYYSDWTRMPGKWYMTATLSLSEDGDPFANTEATTKRITDVSFMSGKYFYLIGDTVLFTQNITDIGEGYDKCYQDADPTSEEISDVLPTDGGYVKFETMGDGLCLKSFNRGVLVFGRDLVYGLLSPLESRFTATDYDTVELARAGICGARSAVSTSDSVYYWSPLGIYRIGTNPNTDNTTVVENITYTTIKTFYNKIPAWAKERCAGAFDSANNRIYWMYPSDENKLEVLDAGLVLDLNYGAFMPIKIAEGGAVTDLFESIDSYSIQPTIYLRANGLRVTAGGEYVVAAEENEEYNRYSAVQFCIFNNGDISFGDFNSREFVDWDSHEYDSYMVSKPIVLGDTFYNKQVPILQTLFKRTEEGVLAEPKQYIAPSGAMLRMRWGWSLEDLSNRWDLVQNAYRPQKDFLHDDFVESRLHIRGRGKSFQIELRNDDNKDLRLAGINILARV